MKKQSDGRRLSAEQQEIVRLKAVQAVLNGEKQVTVAKLFGVTTTIVSLWVKKARQLGISSLKAKKRGGKKPGLLKGWQASWVVRTIRDKHPEQLKLNLVLWTREAVQKLIEQRFGIKLAIRTVGDYLSKWGLTPQKPAKSAYQQDTEAVKKWQQEEYPALVARAKAQKALIYWGDEMGLRSEHWYGRSYSPKGQTPVVKTTGQRYGVNMISAVSNLGKLAFSIFEGNLIVNVFLDFLSRLIRFNKGRKVILIVDGHPVHRAKAVTQWLEGKESELELIFLPGYSPELNPDEMLNQDVKTTVFKNRRPKNKADLKALLSAKLHSIQKQPAKIRSYFQARSVQYSAA